MIPEILPVLEQDIWVSSHALIEVLRKVLSFDVSGKHNRCPSMQKLLPNLPNFDDSTEYRILLSKISV